MSSLHSKKIAIPEGFADLSDANRWSSGLERARLAINSLCLQKIIYDFEHVLAMKHVLRLELQVSSSVTGLKVKAFVMAPGGETELRAMLISLFKNKDASTGLTELGKSMETLRSVLLGIESLSRQTPGMLMGASALGALGVQTKHTPVILTSSMSWQCISKVMGANEAAMLMERAQISKASKRGG